MSSYADRVACFVNSTYVGFALAISNDTGILQVLLDAQKPLTSQEIADQRGLKERYVRELLGSLATAEVIHVSTNEAGSLVYQLEEDEKKVFRTHITSHISVSVELMKVYDDVKSCMSKTGPYGFRIPTAFHDALEGYNSYRFNAYVEGIMKSADGLKAQLESGIDVIEVGCGTTPMLAKLAQMFPESSFTASDNLKSLVDQQKAKMSHLPNVECAIIDLCSPDNLPDKQYDWVYCVNVIHNVPNPPEALRTIRKLVKPGGIFTMIGFVSSGSHIGDRGKLALSSVYTVSAFICIPESFQQPDSHPMGTLWGTQTAVDLLTDAGFGVTTVVLDYPVTLFVCK
ncbi:hypothetical protein BsWGS_10784 [Bradybaena similaris]